MPPLGFRQTEVWESSIVPFVATNYAQNPNAPLNKWVCAPTSPLGPFDTVPTTNTQARIIAANVFPTLSASAQRSRRRPDGEKERSRRAIPACPQVPSSRRLTRMEAMAATRQSMTAKTGRGLRFTTSSSPLRIRSPSVLACFVSVRPAIPTTGTSSMLLSLQLAD